jgi:hypothetical protein
LFSSTLQMAAPPPLPPTTAIQEVRRARLNPTSVVNIFIRRRDDPHLPAFVVECSFPHIRNSCDFLLFENLALAVECSALERKAGRSTSIHEVTMFGDDELTRMMADAGQTRRPVGEARKTRLHEGKPEMEDALNVAPEMIQFIQDEMIHIVEKRDIRCTPAFVAYVAAAAGPDPPNFFQHFFFRTLELAGEFEAFKRDQGFSIRFWPIAMRGEVALSELCVKQKQRRLPKEAVQRAANELEKKSRMAEGAQPAHDM